MNSTKMAAAVGVVAKIMIGATFVSESQKSSAEKLGDSLEEVPEDVTDAVKDAGDR